jgi:nitrogen fixation protein FixH
MSDQPERKSLWIPWLFVGGFGIMLLANISLVLFAMDTWTGLTNAHPYQTGLAHNRTLERRAEQEHLGWRVAGAFRPDEGRRGRLVAEVTGAQGAPLEGARVEARIIRPFRRGLGFSLEMRDVGNGRFEAPVTFPADGIWDVEYRVVRGSDELVAHQRLQVR